MARDPLAVLLRLRGIDLDAARRALAAGLRAEAEAAARVVDIETAMTHEMAVQQHHPVEDGSVESYAAWLQRARSQRRDAQTAVVACAATVAEARVSVNEARAATRALEAALARLQDQRDAVAARLEQQAVDEAAAECTRPERWSG